MPTLAEFLDPAGYSGICEVLMLCRMQAVHAGVKGPKCPSNAKVCLRRTVQAWLHSIACQAIGVGNLTGILIEDRQYSL